MYSNSTGIHVYILFANSELDTRQWQRHNELGRFSDIKIDEMFNAIGVRTELLLNVL